MCLWLIKKGYLSARGSIKMNYKFVTLTALSALAIIYMSSIPDYSVFGSASLTNQLFSNLAHIPTYAVLSFLCFNSFKKKKDRKHLFMINGLICFALLLFAILDETHQSFVPGRIASLMDIGLDIVGIAVGFAATNTLKVSAVIAEF